MVSSFSDGVVFVDDANFKVIQLLCFMMKEVKQVFSQGSLYGCHARGFSVVTHVVKCRIVIFYMWKLISYSKNRLIMCVRRSGERYVRVRW